MPFRERVAGDEYSPWIGLVFIFNLIVGTGALTLPAVFAKAGWCLGLILIVVLAFISYMTVTFIIESMACANAVIHWRRLQFLKRDRLATDDEVDSSDPNETINPDINDASIEHTPLFSQSSRYYVLDNKIELGEMAGLFFNDIGRILFYLCIAIYLYGDLSIYSAAVSKTLRDVICDRNMTSDNMTDDQMELEPCWHDYETLTRLDCYRLSLVAFIMLLGPFTFFNVTKTKYIQMCTILLRWLAFTVMISIAIHRLFVSGNQGQPPAANIVGVPTLFGVCIYSFMCHHSLPSLLAPISSKKSLKSLLSIDYSLIAAFYLCLALTGAFAFSHLEDLYTLNFVPVGQGSFLLKSIEYFLSLFPVFTLSASFPIIAITLRNNLQTLFLDTTRIESYNFFLRRVMFPLLAIVPPVLVTYYTDSLTSLVGFTGSYAGSGIQYFIPIALVYSARKTCSDLLGQGIQNEFRSPFVGNAWLVGVGVWAITCVILVTVNFFIRV
ncbi:hypothetical protein HA402_014861 [Bradysia odoriphaga]|nr:hypothetical protein HA402_014861 [Bradysia odoriphaga]